MERPKSPVFIFINAGTGSATFIPRNDFPIIHPSTQHHISAPSISAMELNPYTHSSPIQPQRQTEIQLDQSTDSISNHTDYHSSPSQRSTHCALNSLSGQFLPQYRPMLNTQIPQIPQHPTSASNWSTINDSNSLGYQLSTSQHSDNAHISNRHSLLHIPYPQAPSFSSPPPYECTSNPQNSALHIRPPPSIPPRPRSAYLQRVPVRTPELLLAQHWPSSSEAPLQPAQSSPVPAISQSYSQPGTQTHHISTGMPSSQQKAGTVSNTGPFRCPRCRNGVDESAVPGWRPGRNWVRFCMVCRDYT